MRWWWECSSNSGRSCGSVSIVVTRICGVHGPVTKTPKSEAVEGIEDMLVAGDD